MSSGGFNPSPTATTLQPMPDPLDPLPFWQWALLYADRLGDVSETVTAPAIDVPDIPVPESPVYLSTTPPTLDTITWTLPNLPTDFSESLTVESLLPEAFDQSPPTLVLPTAPTPTFGDAPDAPGVAVPTDDPQLSLSLPSAPDLLSISVAPFDGITIPAVDFAVPEFTLVAPSIQPYQPGAAYASTLLTAVRDDLLDRIQNGGTGLNPDVEGAIWDRGREREYQQAADAAAELDRMEAMGFSLPPGVWVDARLKVQTELAKNSAGLSREIVIKQAELELANVQQALQTAQVVEAKAIDYANQIEQRSFDSARYVTEAGIAVYTARVQAYGAYVEAYRAKVAIYDAQVRAELGKVEAYRAEVAAEQAKAQVNQARVDQFRAQTDAALAAVEVYKAEIGGIQAKAEIEKLKVQIFGEQVRAYASKVNAYTASVEGFRATVGAEASKQDAFRAAVDAYGAQVSAGAKAVDARISEFTAKLQAKQAEWSTYTSRAQAETSRVQAIAAKNEAVARVYQSEAAANSSYNDVLARQWASQTQLAINVANVALEQAKANAELYITQRSMLADAAKIGATISAQMASAAISANNYSTSFSSSSSTSTSTSSSSSTSNSNTNTTSDIHQRIESV